MGPLAVRLKSCPDAYRSLKVILQVARWIGDLRDNRFHGASMLGIAQVNP
jgi:hypothetical protein